MAAAKKLKGPGGIKKQKNVTKLGEATSKRMQEKLNQIKKSEKKDTEIKSDSEENFGNAKQSNATTKKNQILNDPFFEFADDGSAEGETETADQKRLRLANKILDEYAKEDKNDFFETLQAKTQAEEDIFE